MKTVKIQINQINKQSPIKVSYMTGKLAGFLAINTNTLSNEFCQKMQTGNNVCKFCYSQKMLMTSRRNCVKPWQENSDILSSKQLEFDQLPVINAHSFRFHGHGELINYNHFVNLVNIAYKNPFTHFSLWTKRKDIIAKYAKQNVIPDNLILIFSNPSIDRIINKVPKHFNKVFNVNVTGEIKPGQFKCTGKKCLDCMACYRKNDKSIIVEKLK